MGALPVGASWVGASTYIDYYPRTGRAVVVLSSDENASTDHRGDEIDTLLKE